jgi:hypothetical protein
VSAALLLIGAAHSMEFSIRPHEGRKIIIADGSIQNGDAEKLAATIPLADRDQYGNIPMYLNSPGGSVGAAFELVKLMDLHEFSALVGSEAICASACASIVFISARYHLVIGSGRIGLHTCYSKGSGSSAPEPSAFCNEEIRENAVRHGTSYSAIRMWDDYAPGDMAWFDAETACRIGLCGPPGFDHVLAVPSFDCRRAKLESEKLICADKRLSRHEASMAKVYAKAIAIGSSNEKAKLRQAQRDWLSIRDQCREPKAAECILRAIDDRREILWNYVIQNRRRLVEIGLKARK